MISCGIEDRYMARFKRKRLILTAGTQSITMVVPAYFPELVPASLLFHLLVV